MNQQSQMGEMTASPGYQGSQGSQGSQSGNGELFYFNFWIVSDSLGSFQKKCKTEEQIALILFLVGLVIPLASLINFLIFFRFVVFEKISKNEQISDFDSIFKLDLQIKKQDSGQNYLWFSSWLLLVCLASWSVVDLPACASVSAVYSFWTLLQDSSEVFKEPKTKSMIRFDIL